MTRKDSEVGNGNVFDIHGRPTGLSTRLVYRIATSGKFLWALNGVSNDAGDSQGVQGQPRGSGGSEWHKNSNECEWSIHEVPGSSNPKKYYIVTKGRVLSAAHGASNTTQRGKNYHSMVTRPKTGGSEWHRAGPESQWMFESRGGDYFRITTSHKVLWASHGGNRNGVNNVYGMNKPNAGGSQWHIDSAECKWEFIPKMASYESRLYDFTYVTPGEFSGAPRPNWSASVLLSKSYQNPAGSATTVTQQWSKSRKYIHESEYTLENTTSITLSNNASVTAEASMPGLGSAGATVETGLELSTSITNRGRFRWQQENQESITYTVAIAPGARGRVVTTYYEGPFNIPFNCKCDLMASVKMAPSQAFAVQDPSSSYAHDEMLKAVLNGVGFNESGSSVQDIVYDYDKCTFVNSGTMRGESGLRSETIVTVEEGPKPVLTTVDDSDMED